MEDKAFSVLSNLEDIVTERSNIKQTLMTDFLKKKNNLFSHFSILSIQIMYFRHSYYL
jgi:hypothetical protein